MTKLQISSSKEIPDPKLQCPLRATGQPNADCDLGIGISLDYGAWDLGFAPRE
jgi:hypothetical protein